MKLKLIHYSPLEKEVVSLFKTNLTQAEIAKKFSVYDDELLKFYRSGFTYKQIGEKFNIPLTTVAYRIKKLEVSNA